MFFLKFLNICEKIITFVPINHTLYNHYEENLIRRNGTCRTLCLQQ